MVYIVLPIPAMMCTDFTPLYTCKVVIANTDNTTLTLAAGDMCGGVRQQEEAARHLQPISGGSRT